jgi:hypothetical protein
MDLPVCLSAQDRQGVAVIPSMGVAVFRLEPQAQALAVMVLAQVALAVSLTAQQFVQVELALMALLFWSYSLRQSW